MFYLIDLWEGNEIVNAKYLAQCLVQTEQSKDAHYCDDDIFNY